MKRKVLILSDLEGVIGTWNMAEEQNDLLYAKEMDTIIKALRRVEAFDITVCDTHNGGGILKKENMEEKEATILYGMESIDFKEGFDVAMLTGFHGRAGADGVLCHSLRFDIKCLELDGTVCGEVGLFKEWLEMQGIPVIAVCGAEGIEGEFYCTKTYMDFNEKRVSDDAYQKLSAYIEASVNRPFEKPVRIHKKKVTVALYNADAFPLVEKAGYIVKEERIVFSSADKFMQELFCLCNILNYISEKIMDRNCKFVSYIQEDRKLLEKVFLKQGEILDKSLEQIEIKDIQMVWKLLQEEYQRK